MSLEGILLVDKCIKYTSFDVVRLLRTFLGIKKIGHAGTLDPLATGLLVVLIGKYTKFSNFLLNNDKEYIATLKFGIGTDTDDIYGKEIICGDPSIITEANLKLSVKKFCGYISQIPPTFSAIKVNGERAYKLARKGKKFKIKSKQLIVKKFDILNFNCPFLDFRIKCSKGTYIRSIARDIGNELGVPAHLISLRRIASGSFTIKDALEQNQLKNYTLLKDSIISATKLFNLLLSKQS